MEEGHARILGWDERKSGEQAFYGSAGDTDPLPNPEDGEREGAALDRPVERGAVLPSRSSASSTLSSGFGDFEVGLLRMVILRS